MQKKNLLFLLVFPELLSKLGTTKNIPVVLYTDWLTELGIKRGCGGEFTVIKLRKEEHFW
jgi:hypothetical protein